MISILTLHKNSENKIELDVKENVGNLYDYLYHKNFCIYDTVSAKGIAKKNLYKKDGKYYVIGKIDHKNSYINKIILYDVTQDIQNPENRL